MTHKQQQYTHLTWRRKQPRTRRNVTNSMPDNRFPIDHLSPLATRVDAVLADVQYDMTVAIDAVDAAVAGHCGLFEPTTPVTELRSALDDLSPAALPNPPVPDAAGDAFVLYVDGSSRGNPGPAGAGAVVLDAERNELARLGRPVGSRTDNNTAEYVALRLGLSELLARYEPCELEVRIDSMTVIRDVWDGTASPGPEVEAHSEAIAVDLSALPAHTYTHLTDSDPNPADALATVGADIAALGP